MNNGLLAEDVETHPRDWILNVHLPKSSQCDPGQVVHPDFSQVFPACVYYLLIGISTAGLVLFRLQKCQVLTTQTARSSIIYRI